MTGRLNKGNGTVAHVHKLHWSVDIDISKDALVRAQYFFILCNTAATTTAAAVVTSYSWKSLSLADSSERRVINYSPKR